ncbi:phage protein [Shewanella baltica OS183]|uniref:HNH endonuclease n=1 Tax=Shewanella baltica TaxID=62322 RepID=UPI0001E10FF4|nr:HNH endonuclease [Shewanella baltica]AEG12032.1 phage protein [Shewanella baltica BA175]EHQ14431.1 phage protein [Shewanella baltica OS183]QYX66205.1 HNH endonuclease [Shewanella putrefaciens]
MVAKLNRPVYDSVQVIRAIFAERVHNKEFYEALLPDLVGKIVTYIEFGGDPSKVDPFDLSPYITQQRINEEARLKVTLKENPEPLVRLIDKRKTSLIGLYYPAKDKLPYDILENMRRKHGLLFCPSCGEPGKPGTLDHYFPKDAYPELAAVLVNLTPMCSECQGRKGTDFQDKQGKKIFIHPYFDPVDQVLISLDIHEPYSCPAAFNVSIPANVDLVLRRLVCAHIRGVDFVERFEDFCRSQYMTLLGIFAKERLDPDPDTAIRIVRRFLRNTEDQSVNRWETIFYRGVLNNPNLLNYLDNGELPDFL